jgi:VCBS repeat-containing protein
LYFCIYCGKQPQTRSYDHVYYSKYIIMKTGTLVNRLVLTLFGFSITFLSVGASGQTLTLYDIPDQTVNQGQSFSVVNLDNFIDVPAKDRHKIKWDATGADQLSVNIDNDRKASVAVPSNTWTGSETITFHATDTELNTGSDAATFTVKELVNAAPVVSDIPNQQYEEGTAFQPISLDNYVTDADNTNHQLTWSASGNSALSVNIDASTHTAVVAAPNIDWNGSETIVFQATDPQSASSQDAATFTLTPVNDPPVVSNILDQSIKSNESFSTIPLDNYVTDVDNTKAELSWSITGNTSLLPSIDGSHVATINKPDGWTGSEKLTFTVNDPSNASAADDATFEVKAVNASPVAVNDSYSTTQGATLNITAPAGVLSNDTDADNDPLTAIKVTDPAHGTLTLNSDGSFSYVNDGSAFTTDAFTYKASDGTNESNVATVTINITLVNVAPVLGGIEAGTLAYTEGNGAVSVTGTITVSDADNSSLASAVISISNNYQNGEDVLSFVTASGITGSWNASAGQLTLSGTSSVLNYRNALRAVKYTNNSATPSTLTRTVTFMVNDGTDNSNTQSRNISVTATNIAPVLGGIEAGTLAYTEGDGPVSITGAITVTDADNSSLASAVITISSNYQNGEDVLSFATASGITGSWNASAGQLTLSGTSSVLNYRNALRAVKYTNNSATPSTLTRTITFMVNDGTDNSNTQSRNISVTATNIAPVLGGIEAGTLAYTEGDGPVSITGAITVTDADNSSLASAVISISNNYQNTEDVLSFVTANGITGSWNASTGQLTLTGTASVANYRTALRAVKYTNSSASPSNLTRTVTFMVNDGTDNSNTQSRNISVTPTNIAPVLSAIESGTLAYTEGDGAVIVTGTISASDADNTNLSSAIISISNNYQNTEDVLSFATANGITGSWNATTGQLTLSGTSSVTNYRNALRAVKYTNNSASPAALTRTVTFLVNDGTDNSNTQSRNISVTGINSAPVLASIESGTLAYTEGDGPVSVTGTITVTDVDNANLSSALITISSNYQNGEDVLSFATANGITGSWDASTGQLTLSGSSSVANYRTALRSVKYTNSSATPVTLTRTVTFRVNDGTGNSNTQSRNISVTGTNSVPVLAGIESTALAYTEGAGPVSITSTITATDADDVNLASAVVTISSNYQIGEDVLSFATASGITGSWNSAAGQLTLSGSSSVANYRTALRSVKYTNTSGTPATLTRTVTFLVNDGTDNSNTQSRNISVNAFNSAPVLGGIETTALSYTEGAGPVSITSTITVTDADDVSLAAATVTVSGNYQNGEDVLSFTTANGITASWSAGSGQLTLSGIATVASYQAALRSVKYTNTSTNPNTAPRNISFRVSDGTDNSNLQSRNIVITAVNNAPVIAGIEATALDYTEGDGPVSVSNTITVTDNDNLTLQSAVVTISANYKNPQDVLSYTNANGITGSWNATTGQLTLSGTVSPANYQAALRSVKYTNTSNNPSTAIRTVTFSVNDGTLSSNVVDRDITVTRVGTFSGSISGSASFCTPGVMPIILNVADGTAPFTATLRRTGSVANKDTVITGIATFTYTINVKLTGSYELFSLTDANNEVATVSSTPVVLAFYTKPSGVLSGGAPICQDGTSKSSVTVNLSGTAPWTYTIRRGSTSGNDTTLTGVTSDPNTFKTRITSSPMTVRLVAISDAHCAGDTTGSGTLRISYLASPNAAIQGQDSICPAGTGNLKLTITGTTGPWNITYKRDGANPVDINVPASPFNLAVQAAGTYTLSKVQQTGIGGCTGKVSGSGRIVARIVPTATLSGSPTFCQFETGSLNVNLTGNSPWKFSYKHNSDTVVVENVNSSPNTFSINKAGTYTLVNVIDQKKCVGTVSGSANVTITPAPDVSMSGLAPAYDKNSEQMVTLTGNPAGGSFTGSSALFNSNGNWFFLPRYAPAGTYNIVYSYRDGSTQCFGYDTSTVRVLEANAIIEFPENRTKYCQNEVPFDITGVNLADNIGSFTISGDAGLVDHGNNTATVDPSVLSAKEYTVTYTYFDGTTLNVKSTFEVGKSPVADFKWESECYEKDQPIEFRDASSSTFGNITAYHWKVYTTTGYDTASTPDITYTYSEAGNHVIELQVETSYGCSGVVSKVFGLRPTIVPHIDGFVTETFENNPLSWRSATLPSPTTNSWVLGTPGDTKGINGAASGTTCWFTNLPSSDAPREQSWVSSPCYDFTGLNRPLLKMQIWRDFNGRRDGAVLQATTDSAKTWFNIGQLDDGLNWFNEYSILGNPGNQSIGWSSIQDGDWKEARHSLDMLKGKTRVQFRIAYGSDGTVQNTDGFAFDDFWIGERDRRVLVEHFTNVSDASSQKADSTLNALVDSDSLNTVDLQYHTSFPGDDPFNAQEPYAPSARLLYYGVSEVPFAILNGGYETGYRFDYDSHDGDEPKDLDANLVHLESLNDADFVLKFTDSNYDPLLTKATFKLEIYSMRALPSREYTIHAGIYERRATATGINGETVYRNVVRALLPDAAGITYSGPWTVNEQRNYNDYEWSVPEGVKPDQLYAFGFIQDEGTQEIYQVNNVKIGEITGTVDLPSSHDKFIVFPNPANDHAFIRFDKPQRDEVRIDMYNNLGSLVYTGILKQTDTDAEIKTDQYPDGLYIIRATSGNQLLGVSKLNITR